VITDRFSKLTHTVLLRTTFAFVVAKAFCDHWIFVYGPPRYVLTDKGPQYTSKGFLAVCRELGVNKVFATAYHPQTNGQVERFNRTIINSLRGYVTERQGDWDEYTAAITFGCNCRIHASIGLAPFELVLSRSDPGNGHGRNARDSEAALLKATEGTTSSGTEKACRVATTLQAEL
jgi:hypothetical protein